jgi:hypothetical protein
MRATFDIDEDILDAVRRTAAREGRTPDAVAEDALRRGLAAPAERGFKLVDGFPVLDDVGTRVTSEMVRNLLDDLD